MTPEIDAVNAIKPIVDSLHNQQLVTSLLSGCIVLAGWLASKLFDSGKKEIKEIKADMKETGKEIHAIQLSLENLKGQMALALTLPKEMDAIKRQVWEVDSKANAAWRVLDKKRVSDS